MKLILRGSLSMESGIKLQNAVRAMGLMGLIRVTRSYVEIDLEGPRPKLESVSAKLQQTPFFTGPVVMEQAWLEYNGQFKNFRVAV